MAGLANLAYSMILADTTRSLALRVGYNVSRNTCLLCVTIFVLLPLCMVKKLSVLAPFSVSRGSF
jgi:amino acid permease